MSILTNLGKITNFRSLLILELKFEPNIDSFGLIVKTTFPLMISYEKRIRFTLFLTIYGHISSKKKCSGNFRKLPTSIPLEPNMLET